MPELPTPFSERSTSEWIAQFCQASASEERLRALQAIGSQCSSTEVAVHAQQGLSDSDPTVKALAAKLLGTAGTQDANVAEMQMRSLLSDGDPDVRFESARALIRLKSSAMVDAARALIAFLDEPETHPLMQASVINALVEADLSGDLADHELRTRLQKLLDHDRAEVRESVANAFAKWSIMAKSLTTQLLPSLDDSEPFVREKIALALGEAGVANDAIVTALQAVATDEDTEVAKAATEALRKLNQIAPK